VRGSRPVGCGGVSIRIARDGDRVVWEWLDNGAITQRHVFDAATYDAEVVRASADHSGEPFAQPV